jgi:hypothetical protein
MDIIQLRRLVADLRSLNQAKKSAKNAPPRGVMSKTKRGTIAKTVFEKRNTRKDMNIIVHP